MSKKLVITSLFVATTAFAGGLQDSKLKKDWADNIKKTNEATQKACGFEVATTMDDAFLKAVPRFEALNHSITGTCENAHEGIQSLCGDADVKAAIKKGVKKMVCKPHAKGDGYTSELKNGVLTITYGEDAGYITDKFKTWIQGVL